MTVAAQLDDRIVKCHKILQSDPNSQIFAALAEAYRKKGDLDTAFRVCQNGLRIHPSYGSAHIVMAKINLDRGLYDWAETEVVKAREIDGNSRAIELLLAEIHIYKGDFINAIRLLKKLHESDPTNEHISKLLDIAERIPREQQEAVRSATDEAPTATVTAPPAPDAVDAEGTSPLSSSEVLTAAMDIPGTEGALLINSEGLVLESQWRSSMDATICGATMAEVDLFLTQELVKASFGLCSTILIETGGPVFYMYRVKQGSFLFVGASEINLGTLRMRISSLMSRYEAT